jgi:hypothetical protein
VSLQGRSGNNSGARIFLDGTEIVSTGTDGKYWLYNVTSGPHSVRIERMSYLCTETQVSVSAGQTSTLPDVMLRVGDATGDGRVNIFDLVLVAQSYGTSPPRDLRADVNGDNRVNIFDLVWVAQNWQVWCPTPWSSASATLTSVSPTKIELHSLLRSDHSLTVEVWARGTKNLFAADVHLRFDPVRLKVVDAQTGFIDTLVTDSVAGFTVPPQVDTTAGTVVLAGTRLAQAEPLSGDVLLGQLEVQLVTGEPTTIDLETVTLADHEGNAVPVEIGEAEVRVGGGRVFLPFVSHQK